MHTYARAQKVQCTLRGHTGARILSRCCVFSHHTNRGATQNAQQTAQKHVQLVAAADERDNSILLWDCARGAVHQRLDRHATPVLDIVAAPFSDSHPEQQLLCTLSNSVVKVYDCVC